jgi:sulfite exporter TauE/SafE
MPTFLSNIGLDSLFATYLLTGIAIGFGHCIGMCGPLVISLTLNLGDRNVTLPHLIYNCGRILTYTVLGAVMGATGSFTMIAAHIRSLQVGAMLFAGLLVTVMGLAMGDWIPQIRFLNPQGVPFGSMGRIFKKLSKNPSAGSYLPIGLLLGLLPCGPVYTALLGAARAGMAAANIYQGALTGMALMAAFGLGTIPALFILGKVANTGWMRFRDSIYKTGAVLMVILGIYFIGAAIRY